MKSKYHKLIASAPTPEKKWGISLHGGLPPSEFYKLVMGVYGVRTSLHSKDGKDGKDWQYRQIEFLKKRFVDLLFPALWEDKHQPFLELLDEMAKFRKEVRTGKIASLPKKVEAARLLDTAILSLEYCGKLDSMKTVLAWLDQNKVEFSDERHVRRRMKQLGVQLVLRRQKADK